MKKFVRFLICLVSLNTFGAKNALARANLNLPSESADGEMNTAKNCETLLYLETKGELSVDQERLGQLIHDLIAQISESPLKYCGQFKMTQVVERDPDPKLL